MSRQITVKPKTDTESADVNVAGISVKVKVHYPGDLILAMKVGVEKKVSSRGEAEGSFFSGDEKSAEGILGHINQWLKAQTLV